MDKVLISNRSEIACRIFQACRELGLSTVGIRAPGDEEARHLTFADEVQDVRGYLEVDSIVEAAVRSGAKYVHPGYGFLSERPVFARAVERAGIAFVGPKPETMELMGDKIAAKNLAGAQGVPTLPWAIVTPGQDMKDAAKKVGFPLLLKASAGGGGKGMRRVARAEELDAAAESASAEAKSAFGDGTLFLERFIEKPRHIEVQVFGDGTGHGVHLHERECSLQRRHQKVWEEATAPALSEATRNGIFEAALKLVRAVKYRSAGTLEFLVDEKGSFYFLEMNTRLQVEHPVTENVTGVDLVRTQLLQAMQPKEAALKETPSARGHSIEVRLYAEDPSRGYIPTPGTVEKLRWPAGPGIRVDSGIEEGQTIGTQFDSMLAKLIVHAGDRAQAIERMRFALENTVILGVGTNQSFLRAMTLDKNIRAGKVDTNYLERDFRFSSKLDEKSLELLGAGREAGLSSSRKGSPWSDFGGSARGFSQRPGGWVIAEEGGSRTRLMVAEQGGKISASVGGVLWQGEMARVSRGGVSSGSSDADLTALFPGKVRKVLVQAGAKVAEGETLLLVEAMKMEFSVKAPFAGTVKTVHVSEGQQLSPGVKFLDLEHE